MSKELAINQEKGKPSIANEHQLSVIEQVVMQGDLSKLTSDQRVMYYHKVCDSCNLNPYTRPFDYISFNGKLTLYARKDATEQLRKINGISIDKLEGKVVDDLYIVVAIARTKDGRIDQATGAVTIGNLKGEAKANAIMKAETKAKRRVTLSISGMGWTDESEIESIPNAVKVDVDLVTGEIKNPTIDVQPIQDLTKDQIDDFYKTFNGDEKMTREYIAMCMKKKKWTESEAIRYAQKDILATHDAYSKWKEKQKPAEITMVEAPSMEPASLFDEEGK
jgi:hypothetical protein